MLGPIVTNAFEELRVNAAVHVGATRTTFEEWYPIRSKSSVLDFEYISGVEKARVAYNGRCFARIRREKKPVLGQHAGFRDFFTPVGDVNGAWGTLAVGPFATRRPTGTEVLARWRSLTGTQGRTTDPAFAYYLSLTLSMLTLEGALLEDFKRLTICFALLLEERVATEQLAGEVRLLRQRLAQARFAEHMWESAQDMLDDRRIHAWQTDSLEKQRAALGLKQVPGHAVVGLLRGRRDEVDALDDVLARDAFQRACVDLIKRRGGVVCGRLGDHGVALLVDDAGSALRRKVKLVEVGERAAALAKRFGLRLHLGVSSPQAPGPLSRSYHLALSAAEQALSQGLSVIHAEDNSGRRAGTLAAARAKLGQALEENPSLLLPRFQRYIETAVVRSGYRLEATRAYLEAGFDHVADGLASSGVVDDKSLADLRGTVERAAAEVNTINELSAVYRRVMSDIELALLRPKEGRQDRSIQRSIGFIREHLGDPLTLAIVARVAGFAPRYFSQLFKRSEQVTFRRYVQNLRIERAKQMLLSTSLNVERVGQLSGFATRAQFHRAFKESLRLTPRAYRKRGTRRM